MRIGFVADVHVANHRSCGGAMTSGLNDRCRLVLGALKRAYDTAKNLNCQRFVVLGDLFDTDRPTPQIVRAVQDVFNEYTLKPILLMGNHELTSTADGDHALGPLQDRAMIVDKPHREAIGGGDELVLLPLRPGPGAKWLADDLKALEFGPCRNRILCLHLGISDNRTAPFLRGSDDSISVDALEPLCRKYAAGLVFAGNWHDRQNWSLGGEEEDPLDIYQVGTLSPTGWDNAGLTGYGSLVIYDSNADTVELQVIPGPRFLKFSAPLGVSAPEWGPFLAKLAKAKAAGNTLFLRIEAHPEHVLAATAMIATLREAKTIADGKAGVDQSVIQTAVREAADRAKSASSLPEAVAQYISAMPLDEGVDRNAVLTVTREFLAT